MTANLLLLVVYATGLIALGVWIGRRVSSTREFFVADRALGPGLLCATLLAANIGAGSTTGAAGLGYRDGLSAWWWVGSAGLGSIPLALWVGPRIRDLAERHDLRTVGDYLEVRYSAVVRVVVAALLWVGTLAVLAAQLIAGGTVLQAVAGLPQWAGCVVSGVVMTAYFMAGGLLTSVWVNLVQLVVLLGGFVLALPWALASAGGWEAVAAQPPPAADYWSFWRGGASGWPYLAMLAPAFLISPGLLQKIYGARDRRAVVVGVGVNAGVLLLFAFLPPVLGIVARAAHPDLADSQMALPTLLAEDVPALLGGLGLAALFSAEVSSADAILFMLATSLSQDLYRRFLHPSASDRRVLAVARGAALAGGILGVGLAVMAETIVGTLSVFYSVLTVCLFVPLIAGLYCGRSGTPEALAAIAAGVAAMAAVHLATGGAGVGWVSPALAGTTTSAFALCLVLTVRRPAPAAA